MSANKEIKWLVPGEDPVNTINELIDEYNSVTKNLSLQFNFNGQIVAGLIIPAGGSLVIPHKLGIVPLYRIILRQVGNGVISDVPSGWNSNQIKLLNNGAESVTITVMLVRE